MKYIFLWIFLLSVIFIIEIPNLHSQDSRRSVLVNLSVSIQIEDTTDFSDLKALHHILKNKRVVLLGEFNHGAKEINLIKNRWIRHLHENLGFNVLLLESGIGELISANFNRNKYTALRMLSLGLIGP